MTDDIDDNVIDFREAAAKKRGRPQRTQEEKEQQEQDLIEAAEQWLEANPLRECLKQRCYFVQKENRQWIPAMRHNFGSHYPIWSEKFGKAVTHVMAGRGWNHLDCTYTYGACPSDTFNMLDRSGWLEPDIGEYHWLFDVLMQALSGNKPENLDHLEHVLVYKFLHPQAYTLPCLLIHG